jgi:hypothetical protein
MALHWRTDSVSSSTSLFYHPLWSQYNTKYLTKLLIVYVFMEYLGKQFDWWQLHYSLLPISYHLRIPNILWLLNLYSLCIHLYYWCSIIICLLHRTLFSHCIIILIHHSVVYCVIFRLCLHWNHALLLRMFNSFHSLLIHIWFLNFLNHWRLLFQLLLRDSSHLLGLTH